jgi:hypothetical protein
MAIPRTDNELMLWYRNFAPRFAAHATALGFSQADVDAVQADAAMLSYLVGDLLPAYTSALQARTSYKNLIKDGPVGSPGGTMPPAPTLAAAPASVAPGIVPRLRQLVARIKVAPGYTDSIGLDLGIGGPDTGSPSAPASSAKPAPKATALDGSRVRIEFGKGGFDGVRIEARRAGETGWQSLGTDNYSPYTDERPPLEAGKPEVREYRLRYIQRDESVGEWSDIITATTRP